MPTLQKTFSWEPTLAHYSISGINVKFSYPDFVYAEIPDSNGQISRSSVGDNAIELSQEFGNATYQARFPFECVAGKSAPNAIAFLKYFKQQIDRLTNEVEPWPISLKIDVALSSLDNELLHRASIAPLFFLKGFRDSYELELFISSAASQNAQDKLAAFIDRNLFFVNASAYEALWRELSAVAGGSIPYHQPLFLIAYLLDLSDGQPKLATSISAADQAALLQLMGTMELQDPAQETARIKGYFDRLFDFPITTQNIKPQEVAGTFKVKTADNIAITRDDLNLYDLALEYAYTDADGQETQNLIHFDWGQVDGITDNTVAFSFAKIKAIFPAQSNPTLSLYVRTPDSLIVWSNDYKAGNPALKALRIEVPLSGAGAVSPAERATLNNKRLRGQLLDLTKAATLKDAIIVIQAQAGKDAPWQIVGSANADSAGNFSLAYPYGVYTAAQAVVSLMPKSPVAIPIKSGLGDNRTIADDFLYLLLTEPVNPPDKADKADCDCTTGKQMSRLPDQADLIGSDEYMQDLGPGCINLSTPNRTLREYSYQAIVRTSDPDVANYTLRKEGDGRYSLVGENKIIKRKAVSLNNPIRWQDAPDNQDNLSLYQAVSVATGHLLHYKAQFKADGYSLGELLYTLPLAPGQKKQIVIFEQGHTLQGSEAQQLSQAERLAANLTNDRDIADQLSGNIGEGVRGRSSANTEGVSVGLGVAGNAGYASASLGVAGGYSNSHSDAEQDSARNISQFFNEKLRNGLMQNADSYRQQNANVITTVAEGQKYSAATEVVANHNHCHSMTMMYFEVLRHYAIYQELANVEECVFVPLLMTHFTLNNVAKWQDVLAQNLLPLSANTYLPAVDGKHPLLRAFDAVERIRTEYKFVDFPKGRYCDEQILYINGQLQVSVNLPRPKTKYDRILSLPVVNKTITHQEFDPIQQAKNIAIAPFTFGLSLSGGPAMKTVSEQIQVRAEIFDQFMQMDANFASLPPAQSIRVTNFDDVHMPVAPWFFPNSDMGGTITLSKDRFFDGNELDRRQWEAYAKILGWDDVFKFLSAYFKGKLIAEWDSIFYSDIAPVVFERIVNSLHFSATKPDKYPVSDKPPKAANDIGLDADFSSTSRYNGGNATVTLNVRGRASRARSKLPQIVYLECTSPIAGLSDMITFRLENMTLSYATAHFSNLLFSGYLGDDVQDGTPLNMPLTSEDKRSPTKEDSNLANKLIEHLNSNLEHYNKVLWYNLDPDRRYLLLDGFNIQVYNDFGVPVGLKSLASVVKNELVAIAGNAMVFPVASGFKVAKSYIVAKTETGKTEKLTLLDHYKPTTPTPPYRLSAPTRGVYAEALMGVCNACEKVQDGTSQDWTKFGTDEPTTINNLTPATPTVTDWKAAFRDFAAPLVGMQQAPTLPTPGAGLAGLSAALTTSNAFKDITGLDKNQQNAMETYKSNQENAKAFAEMAKTMAGQAHNTDNASKIMDNLNAAKNTGAISKEEHGALVKKHLEQQIDGGEAAKAKEKAKAEAQAEKQKATQPSLSEAAVKAIEQGKAVKAEESDGKGSSKSLQVKNTKPQTSAPATPVKKYYKTIFFQAKDCYGEIMQAEFHVTVNDAVSNQEVGYEEFEFGTGSFRVGFTTPAPTLQIRVSALSQLDAVSPISHNLRYESDPTLIAEAQPTVNVLLKQSGQKTTIQTKDATLTGQKVLDELSKEGSTEAGGKLPYEINLKVAGKIASKHATEVTNSSGHDENKSFEIIVPLDRYDLTVK
ncbi:MAG: hypothetical protein ACKN9T_05405 [Candidatus Methylumidiphilus sp.]